MPTETPKPDLRICRDRKGRFDPKLIARNQLRFRDCDGKTVSMYVHGMTVCVIQDYLMELYRLDVSPDLISTMTNAVLETVRVCRASDADTGRRALEEVRRQPLGPVNIR